MSGWTGISPEKWAEKTLTKMDIFVQKLSLELFSRVILRSPVDTGRFRGNWQVAIGSIPDGVLDLDDKTGTATINRAQAVVLNVTAGQEIILANNLPYGPRLENGHSAQAPKGMVTLSVQEFQQIANEIGVELVRI